MSPNDPPPTTNRSLIWRGVNVIMSIFFLLCTYVQLNDPDPYIWVPIYLIPTLLCLAVAVKADVIELAVWRVICIVHFGCCVLAMVYHLVLVIEIMAGSIYNPLLHEEGRELAGLVIIIIWLAVCWFNPFSSSEKRGVTVTALLALSIMMGLAPLFVWSLCFIESLESSLNHCHGMFPGLLGGAKMAPDIA